jgi:integrase
MKTLTKRGRKSKPHIAADGRHINGLRHRAHDNRWILADGRTFAEPDETAAIRRYEELMGCAESQPARMMRERFEFGERDFWQRVADEIRARPHWVAEQTGIEQIGYLTELKPPTPLPAPAELRSLWEQHATCGVEYMKQARKGWDHFIATTGISSIREITPELAVDYNDALHQSGYGSRTQKHMIDGMRRVLTFARGRAVAMEAISKSLTYLKLLKASGKTTSTDPKPIEVEEWQKLLAKAEGDDRAMLLLMLNGSYYIGEVIDLEWDDIKAGGIVTHREKQGQCVRVCVLWQETLDALAKMKRRGPKLFHTYQGLPIKVCGAFRRFRELAEAAKVKVTPSQLRDGAYTAAVESGASFALCQLLNGHRTGMADHYVKRNPKMVAPACEAIRRKYLG